MTHVGAGPFGALTHSIRAHDKTSVQRFELLFLAFRGPVQHSNIYDETANPNIRPLVKRSKPLP